MSTFRLEFITPLFSRGQYEDRPEIRPPSIRGQLHWWFRALGGTPLEEKAIFGGIHQGAVASKVVVRVQHDPLNGQSFPTLPHKPPGPNASKSAVPPGVSFDLQILMRLGGVTPDLLKAFDRTLETWLLLGSLGLRSTRAAGNFRWHAKEGSDLNYPASFNDYESRCKGLLKNAPLRFALLDTIYTSSETARKVISDTLGGRDDQGGQGDLARLHDPLGKAFQGRKISPLRFRLISIGNEFRIASIWDARESVTGNRLSDLTGIINLLAQRKPALGNQLLASSLTQ